MLLLVIRYLISEGVHVPSVFFYSSTRMMLAALTSLLLTIFLGPFFIRKLYELKTHQPLRSTKECPLLAELHKKKKDTPTMGGALILLSMSISLLIWMDLHSSFSWILLFTTLFLGALGGYDDFLKLKHKNSKGLAAKKKLFFQALFAFLIASYLLVPSVTDFFTNNFGLKEPVAKEAIEDSWIIFSTSDYAKLLFVPFFKDPIVLFESATVIFFFLFFFFVITGSSNAVNLTDGLDGLAAGCLIMCSSVFALIAFLSNNIEIARYLNILYIEGAGEVAIYLLALCGATLGFLWYNGHPAQVFMGDTGSIALGGILGVSAILLKKELLLALVGGVFVAEAVSVILQVISYRYRNKKRIFLCAPLHHHYEYKGWPETKVVLRFWIVALFLAILGVASLKFQ